MAFTWHRSCASLLLTAVLANLTTGCMLQLPPPPLPPRIEPAMDDAPRAPPEGSNGRVVLHAEGESAKVSRVTETFVTPGGMRQTSEGMGMQAGAVGAGATRSQELLCITPCTVDLRQGAHTFVFTAQDDPLRSSTTDVVLTSKTAVVRHAIGHEPTYTTPYLGGAALVLAGTGFTLMGGLATTVGALGLANPTIDKDGESNKGGATTFLAIGLVLLGVGLASGTAGLLLMFKHRPVEQAGATTQWVRP